MNRKLRWGVLSTAGIGWKKVIPAMQLGELTRVDAIASRDLAKAQEMAVRFGIARAYGSYEELLADPEIDAIYNPLPNHLHVPWTIKAAEAGKHVLCEKPIALTAAEAETADRGARADGREDRRGVYGELGAAVDSPAGAAAAGPDRRAAVDGGVLQLLQC